MFSKRDSRENDCVMCSAWRSRDEQYSPGTTVPISVTVANTGGGHNFPTGFPEGRTAWLAIRAYDLATGKELLVHDSFWSRNSLGIGRLTTEEMLDPNYPER